MSTDPQDIVDKWFRTTEITIGEYAETEAQQAQARRLYYTWRDCFIKCITEIKPTDLVEHTIDLYPDAIPVTSRQKRYNAKERAFANEIFLKMEKAGIIIRGASEWGAATLFPPKKKGSEELRVVNNFIPLNIYTRKPAYPTHLIEEVTDILNQADLGCYISADALSSYWAICMRPGDEYKTAFLTPHGQFFYRRMGQGLKGSVYTYTMFADLTFGWLPKTDEYDEFPSLIGNNQVNSTAFSIFMDDHLGASKTFEGMLKFLYTQYFPRIAFMPIGLSKKKLFLFIRRLELVGFTIKKGQIRPSNKHRVEFANFPVPKSRVQVEDFCFITPFLRMFIPGRAGHVGILKQLYLRQEPVLLQNGKKSVKKTWTEKPFEWTSEQ
jgi:hypothetical protein